MNPTSCSGNNFTPIEVLLELGISLDEFSEDQQGNFKENLCKKIEAVRASICGFSESRAPSLSQIAGILKLDIEQMRLSAMSNYRSAKSVIDKLSESIARIKERSLPSSSELEKILDVHSFATLQKKEEVVEGMMVLNALSAPIRLIGKGIETVCKFDAQITPATLSRKHQIYPRVGDVCTTMAKMSHLVPVSLQSKIARLRLKIEDRLEHVYDIPPEATQHSFESVEILATAQLAASAGSALYGGATRLSEVAQVRKVSRAAMQTLGEMMDKDAFQHLSGHLRPYYADSVIDMVQKFSYRIERGRFGQFHPVNVNEVLSPNLHGNSVDSVFFLNGSIGKPIYVVKYFEGDGFVKNIAALEFLNKLDLKSVDFPKAVAVGKFVTPEGIEKGIVAMNYMKGQSVKEIIQKIGSSEIGSQAYSESMNVALSSMESIGTFLAELHSKSLPFATKPHSVLIDFELNNFLSLVHLASRRDIPLGMKRNELQHLVDNFQKNPGLAGFSHGDPHPGNFLFQPGKKLQLIDAQSIAYSVGPGGSPLRFSINDNAYVSFIVRKFGMEGNLTSSQIDLLVQRFNQTYHREFKGVHSADAEAFFKKMNELRIEVSLWDAKFVAMQKNFINGI